MKGVEEYDTNDGPRWRVYYRDGGPRRSRSFHTLARAVQFKRIYAKYGAAQAIAYDDNATASVEEPLTVSEAFERWLDSRVRPSEASKHVYRLVAERSWLPVFGYKAVAQLTGDDVASWVQQRLATPSRWGTPISGRTVEQELGRLSSVLADCRSRGEIARNVAEGIDLPKRAAKQPKVITRHQFDAFLEQFRATEDRPDRQAERNYTLVHLLGSTGMRWGEAIALRWTDIDLDNRVIHITRAFKHGGKGGPHKYLGEPKTPSSVRTVSLYADTVDVLAAHKARSDPSGLVFPGDRLSAAGEQQGLDHAWFMRSHWNPARDRAGLPRTVTPHVLRHSHISWLLAAGAPTKLVSWRVGHETTTITEKVYGHFIPDARRLTDEYLGRVMGQATQEPAALEP